jgi:hypothetical protein
MGNRGAQYGGLAEAPVTIAESVEGIVKQVCLRRICFHSKRYTKFVFPISVREDQGVNKDYNLRKVHTVQRRYLAMVMLRAQPNQTLIV